MRILVTAALAGMMCLAASLATAQTGNTELRGVVRDPSGAVIPNVELKLKDTATAIEKTTISDGDGAYRFPALVAGTYQLTASVSGFQKAVVDGIVINTGRVTDIPVRLNVGSVSTTVEVTAAGVQLELTSNTVSTTIKSTSIQTLPYSSRDSLYFALLMPGAQSSGSDRNTTFNGLPNASLNIMVDGVNNNSQRFKSGGTSFFQFAPTRIDAMEEVTVMTSGMGAESAGQGTMSIQMTTKRGTDQYHFRILEQWHNEFLNAWPYMTKLASHYDKTTVKNRTRQNYALGSVGGPALHFIPFFKDRLFFFAYFEANPNPSTSRQSSTMLQEEAYSGVYRFIDKSGVTRSMNVLNVAGAAGFRTAIDPTIQGMLNEIKATEAFASSFQTSSTYPYQKTMYWNYGESDSTYYPTARLDFQITPSLAWRGTWNYRRSYFDAAPNYPGPEAYKYSFYQDVSTADVWVISNSVDWTISPKMVNNFTFGNQMNWELFAPGYDIHAWERYGNRRIGLPGLDPYVSTYAQDDRNNPVWEIKDNLSWVKGRHTIRLGGSFLYTSYWSKYFGNASGVMQPSLGVRSDDPVYNVLYNAMVANNASTTTNDIGNAMSLYAMLTGRLNGISTTLNVNPDTLEFEQFAPRPTSIAFKTLGLYVQDSFRLNPQLTLNYGLRWQLDGTIHGTKPIYTMATEGSLWGPSLGNFQPGVLGGNMNPGFTINPKTYNADLVNPAPNLGIAWNPNFENGILKAIFGGNKTVIRTSFGMTFYNEGLNAIGNYLSSGTQSIAATANVNFVPGTLFLDGPAPTFSKNPTEFGLPEPLSNYVLNGGRSINYFNQNLKSPYTSNWTFGIQRELARGLVLDVRYVGNKSTHMWHMQNLQEINVVENGFVKEFINAQNNLAISRTAGVASFENRGLTGQVSLPVFEAAFGANGSQPALSQSSGWRNNSYIQYLDRGQAGSFANTLASTTGPSLYCRLVGGNFAPCAALGYTTVTKFPMNFFKANPFATNLNYQDSNGDNNYNALQVEVRKSLSRGLMFNLAYTWSHMLGTQGNVDGQAAEDTWITLRDARLSYSDTGFDKRHNITTYWEYDLPLGPGRWIDSSNPVVSRIIGNWRIGGIHRFISGGTNYLMGGYATFNNSGANGGVVFGDGLTIDKLIGKLDNIVTDYDYSCRCFHTDISDLQMANGAIDPVYFRDGNTPGVIGYAIPYKSKWSYQLDLSVTKEIPITERVKMGIKLDASNFLNHPFQTGYGTLNTTSTSFGRLSSFGGSRTMRIRAYIDF